MKEKKPNILRQKAEELLSQKQLKTGGQISESEMQKLVHELEVHQVELEMQNEELQRAKSIADIATNKYADLYDFAPSGYFSLSEEGDIIECNLTSAKMLGKERSKLINKRFILLVSTDTRTVFNLFFDKIFESKSQQTCEVILTKDGDLSTHVLLNGIVDENEELCNITMIDITERKLAEEEVKASYRMLQRIIDLLPFKVFWKDENQIYLGCNTLFAKDAGKNKPEDIIGKDDFQMGWIDQAELYRADDREILVSKLSKINFEETQTTPKGDKIWLSTSKVPLTDLNGDTIGILGVYQDITERKKAEDALSKSEYQYRSLVEKGNIGIGVDDVNGNLVYFNEQFSKIFGYSVEEIKNLNHHTFIHPDDYEWVEEIHKKRMQGMEAPSSFEFKGLRKDGSVVFIDLEIIEVFEEGGKFSGTLSHLRDITERKQSEESLRESEARFKALHNASFGGITIQDKGLILDCNQGLSKITGYSVNELIGMDGLQLIAEESREMVMDKILAEYEKPYEATGIRKNGEKYPVRLEARMIPYKGQKTRIVEFRDITEQKKAEENLHLAYLRNEAILDAVPDIIMEVDNNKTYTWANNEGIEFFGVEVIGKEAAFYFEGEQDTYKTVAPLFKGSKDIIYVESWQRRKDGEKRLLAWQCRKIKDSDGNVSGTLSSAIDITGRVAAEKALKESEERFQLAMNASRDGLYDWNLVTNEIYYSPGWKSMLGYEDDELPNDFSIWEKLTEPEHVAKSWEMQQELINKQRGRFEMEFKMKHKDGHWVNILSRAEAIFDENGKAKRIVGTHVDISERKQIEAVLRESEKKYRDLINLAQEGIWVIDENNITTFANPSMAKMLKYTQEEMIGKSLFDFMDERGIKIANENLEQRKAGKTEHHDFEFICKNGDRIYCTIMTSPIMDKSGNYKGAIAGVMDISERKIIEENIKKLNVELEEKVIERTKSLEDKMTELARMNKIFVGRELRMVELKQMVKELKEKLEGK